MLEKNLTWSPDARAALLRDESGAIVGTTWGSTACWFPREPAKLVTFGDDGREHVIRCRFCPGCREYERQLLARRLAEHFKDCKEDLWLVTIDCALRDQAQLVSRLKRTRMAIFSSAFFRLGSGSVALIAVGKKPRLSALRALRRCTVSCTRILLSRGRRAFALVTAGILRSRDEFGAWANRFYFRGLKPLPREMRFTRATRFTRGLGKRHPRGTSSYSARAWHNGVTIHLPQAIPAPKVIRRQGAWDKRTAGGMTTVQSILSRFADRGFLLSPPAKPASAMTGIQEAKHPPIEADRDAKHRGRYSSSQQLGDSYFTEWADRMVKLARKREGDGDG